MERSPLINWTFHLRAVSVLLLLSATDLLYIRYSVNSIRTQGASVQIVFGLEVYTHSLCGTHYVLTCELLASSLPLCIGCVDFLQYTIMLLVAINTFLHYLLHSIDLRSEDPWENKTIFMRYVDIGVGEREGEERE